jgi:hypothetical protein
LFLGEMYIPPLFWKPKHLREVQSSSLSSITTFVVYP